MFKLISLSALLLLSNYSVYADDFLHTILPDLITTESDLHDYEIDEDLHPDLVLLRFSNGAANIGRGRMELRGGRLVGNKRKVYQRVYMTRNRYYHRLAGYVIHHPEHNHTHFENFAHYKLRLIGENDEVGDIVASSDKVSFCLWDDKVHDSSLPGYSRYRRYRSCGTWVQGISVGWKDVYSKDLHGQWIDITEVEPGEYWLESTVDPGNLILESNDTNNTARIKVQIPTR